METAAQSFAKQITSVIIDPIIALMFAGAVVVFLWGIAQFMWAIQGEGEGREAGKQHMLWGLVGMFIMVAAYSILTLIQNTVNGF